MSLDRGSLYRIDPRSVFERIWSRWGCCILAAAVWISVTWMFVEGPTRLQMKPSLLIPMPTRTAFVSWTRWHSGQLQTQLRSNGCTQAQHLALLTQSWPELERCSKKNTFALTPQNIHIGPYPSILHPSIGRLGRCGLRPCAALRMCCWPLCRCSICKFQCRIYPYPHELGCPGSWGYALNMP